MPSSQEEFCSALKAARERRGLKLTDISESTKVCPSYFSALERNDLRVWPKGLFRRSFFRGYAGMVGLPVAETLDEFLRLFPEDERAAAASATTTAAPPQTPAASPTFSDLRLALDESWAGPRVPIWMRLAAAVIDLTVVALLGMAIAWTVELHLAPALATAAMTYFSLATAILAESPSALLLRRRDHIVDMLASMLTKLQPAPAAQPEAGDEREWISDATRVRPRGQAPGLRVRFKVSS